MRILTFNHHESYLCALAQTGHAIDVVEQVGSLDLSWNESARPRPENLRAVALDQAVRAQLKRGDYDVVIVHTVKNLVWLFPYFRAHFVFVAHIPLLFQTFSLSIKSVVKKLLYMLFRATHQVQFLAVSDFKRAMWDEVGTVVNLTPAAVPDVRPGVGYDRVIVICNHLAERREELGHDLIVHLAATLPLVVIGNNPGIACAVKPRDFAEFRELIRAARIYLFTVEHPWGDGYNTAMLEAMAMGMAIVTVANPSSPIVHEFNGLVGHTAAEIHTHLTRLLANRTLVDQLGTAAQRTVEERFSKAAFIDGWQRVLHKAAEQGQ